jgi:hypothetical protein
MIHATNRYANAAKSDAQVRAALVKSSSVRPAGSAQHTAPNGRTGRFNFQECVQMAKDIARGRA